MHICLFICLLSVWYKCKLMNAELWTYVFISNNQFFQCIPRISTFTYKYSTMFLRGNKLLKVTKSNIRFLRQYWNVNISSSDQTVILKHETTGEVLHFPSVWLRDNCQCSRCFSQTLYSRLISFRDFKGALLPTSVSVSTNTICCNCKAYTIFYLWRKQYQLSKLVLTVSFMHTYVWKN